MPPEIVPDNAAAAPASTGPATALGAMERASAAASSAASEPAANLAGVDPSKPASPTAGAIVQPGAKAVVPAQGEAPEPRIVTAVQNARTKMREEFGLSEGISAQDVRAALSLLTDLRRDRQGFYTQLGSELGAGKPAAAAEEDEKFPEADLRSEDGRTMAHSDKNVSKIAAIIEKRIMRQIQPLQDARKSEQEQRETLARNEQNRKVADDVVTAASQLPHFEENRVEIEQRLRAMDPGRRRQLGAVGAMYACYNQILSEKVFPGIETAAEQRVRESNAKKAATSRGSAHPSDQGGDGKTPQLNNVSDLARHLADLEARASA